MIQRRSFLGAMLSACTAPAYVKAGILMPVRQIIVPPAGLVNWHGVSDPGHTHGVQYHLLMNTTDGGPVPAGPYHWVVRVGSGRSAWLGLLRWQQRHSGPAHDIFELRREQLPRIKGPLRRAFCLEQGIAAKRPRRK